MRKMLDVQAPNSQTRLLFLSGVQQMWSNLDFGVGIDGERGETKGSGGEIMVDLWNGASKLDWIEFLAHILIIFAFSMLFYPYFWQAFLILLVFGLILQDYIWVFHNSFKNEDDFKKSKHFCHILAFGACILLGIVGIATKQPFLVVIGVLGSLHVLIDWIGKKIGGGENGKPRPQVMLNLVGPSN